MRGRDQLDVERPSRMRPVRTHAAQGIGVFAADPLRLENEPAVSMPRPGTAAAPAVVVPAAPAKTHIGVARLSSCPCILAYEDARIVQP